MPTVQLVFALGLVTACNPTAVRTQTVTPKTAPSTAASPEAAAPSRGAIARHKRTCRDASAPADRSAEVAAMARAEPDSFPAGPPPPLDQYTARVAGFGADVAAENWMAGDDPPISPHRLMAYTKTTQAESSGTESAIAYAFVEVELFPAVPRAPVERWATEVLRLHEFAYEGSSSAADFARYVPVYLEAWVDEHGRPNLEYAVVWKGCERMESYVRFVTDGRQLLRVDVSVNPTVEPETAARWLNGFFDFALGVARPPARRFAHGHKTTM